MAIPANRSVTAFIGFVFNGKHSLSDFNIYRVIEGDRYVQDLTPVMNDIIAEIPGGEGQYYFGTNYGTRNFSINIAFDGLSKNNFYEMRKWLNGKEIASLSFDERPNVNYSAKVTGTPQLQYICFD
jgi:phage-related protein